MILPNEVYVDSALETHPVVHRIRQGLDHLPWHSRGDLDRVIQDVLSYQSDPCAAGKQILCIRPYQGKLVKDCPGTIGHICCGYKIINVMTNCPLDCSYCILQTYLNNPCLTLYPEFTRIFSEIDEILDAHPHRIFRFGTGELGDSLALDGIVRFADEAVPLFARKLNAIFEIKTKACSVDHLLTLNHGGRTVCSWSLNPPTVIEGEEHRAASLEERLRAASRCADAGYHVGFHFDPLIAYPGWDDDYRRVVDLLFEHIEPCRAIWVSLGALRCSTSLKQVAQERFPTSRIFSGELIRGEDGKLRYLKPLRVAMYRHMVSWLRSYDAELFIYLCMERDDVWQEVFGTSPGSTAGLNSWFEERVRQFTEGGQ
ncbi:MAG: DNA photolyase [Deltaproteobacteria bacterium]|nr:DNA photolyase [Deltaproteobacteria bacterium]